MFVPAFIYKIHDYSLYSAITEIFEKERTQPCVLEYQDLSDEISQCENDQIKQELINIQSQLCFIKTVPIINYLLHRQDGKIQKIEHILNQKMLK